MWTMQNPVSLPQNDRVFDLTLRILMVAISVALVGCIGLLAWRWIHPPRTEQPIVAVSAVKPAPAPAVTTRTTATPDSQVLLAPGQVFRCVANGRVTFSDRPCPAVTR